MTEATVRKECDQMGVQTLARRPKEIEMVVGLEGLEPSTSRLSSARSNQLSYRPARLAVLQATAYYIA